MEVAITVALVVACAVFGYFVRGYPILSWPMFTAHAAVVPDLWVRSGDEWKRFEPYDLLPSHALSMTRQDLLLILEYCRKQALDVSGACLYYGNSATVRLDVKDTRVVG